MKQHRNVEEETKICVTSLHQPRSTTIKLQQVARGAARNHEYCVCNRTDGDHSKNSVHPRFFEQVAVVEGSWRRGRLHLA